MNRKATQLAQLVSSLWVRGCVHVHVCVCVCVHWALGSPNNLLAEHLTCVVYMTINATFANAATTPTTTTTCRMSLRPMADKCAPEEPTTVLPGAGAAAPHWLRQQKCCLLFGMLPLDMLIFTQLPSTSVYTALTPPPPHRYSISLDIFRNLFLNYNKLLGSSG